MGTEKRERQKAARQQRVEAARAAQRRAESRRRLVLVLAVAGFVALIALVFALVSREGTDETAGPTTTSTTLESAAGKPCVPLAEPVPAGAPDVPVPEGPPPTDLVVEDLVVGEGEEAVAGATVTVNYIGVACSTGMVFDDSYSRGQPATFPLDQVIEGWTDGIPGMKVGGRRLLVIPPDQAYGDSGSPPDIAPGETLVFVVELVDVTPPGETTTTTTATPVSVPPAPGPGASITGPTPCPAADGSSPRTTSFAEPPPTCIDPAKAYTATFDTTAGTVTVELDAAGMPSTTNNFVVLARYHYYDGTAIFRTDPSIDILQGGSPTTNSASDPGPGYTIPDEGGPFTYTEGQLVMARTQEPNSSGAQFFMTGGPKVSSLDAQGTYLVFGRITAGLDVVQKILASHVADPTSGLGGAPNPPVVVNTVTITER